MFINVMCYLIACGGQGIIIGGMKMMLPWFLKVTNNWAGLTDTSKAIHKRIAWTVNDWSYNLVQCVGIKSLNSLITMTNFYYVCHEGTWNVLWDKRSRILYKPVKNAKADVEFTWCKIWNMIIFDQNQMWPWCKNFGVGQVYLATLLWDLDNQHQHSRG